MSKVCLSAYNFIATIFQQINGLMYVNQLRSLLFLCFSWVADIRRNFSARREKLEREAGFQLVGVEEDQSPVFLSYRVIGILYSAHLKKRGSIRN